jgi:hypothetical protein
LFKDVTTVGFKEYVTKLRLVEAKHLLLNTDTNICEIASAVGYTNVYQFYKVFNRYTQMSPADYRHYYTSSAGPLPSGTVSSAPRLPVVRTDRNRYLALVATAEEAG